MWPKQLGCWNRQDVKSFFSSKLLMLYWICIPQKEETVLLETGSTPNWVINYLKRNKE